MLLWLLLVLLLGTLLLLVKPRDGVGDLARLRTLGGHLLPGVDLLI